MQLNEELMRNYTTILKEELVAADVPIRRTW